MKPIDRDLDMTTRDLYLLAQGEGAYSHPVRTPDGGLSCVRRLIYTHAIAHELNDCGYDDVWCYRTQQQAVAALYAWSGEAGTEPEGWLRHPATGRRGASYPKQIEEET